MTLEVRYFASLVDSTGTATERIKLEHPGTVEQLWEQLTERHPALGRLGYRPLVACDRTYATWDASLRGVAEVAFLPPVSGG